jgi:hypothetical protein
MGGGRWSDPDWKPETPGAFAVIIGVSHYKHLPGGKGPVARSTYGLPQLAVSALTANAFFDWLREKYEVPGCPLAHVWLLLAPTPAEVLAEPGKFSGYGEPTFANCRDAISLCRNEMQQMTPEQGRNSRCFFFFSGHGLEKETDNQILLPCDYLEGPAFNINQAISTNNIVKGFGSLPVSKFFYFVDACRSDASELRDFDVVGTPILQVSLAYRSNRELIAPIQYATTSGTTAWQPADPSGGISFFGQALIEGLQATGRYLPHPPCDILVYDLNRFVSRRVEEILSQYTEAHRQRVRMGGMVADEVITTIQHPIPAAGPVPPAVGQMRAAGSELRSSYDSSAMSLLEHHDLHSVTDSEDMEGILRSIRVFSLKRKQWLDPTGACIIKKFARSEFDGNARPDRNRSYRISLGFVDAADSYWFEVRDYERTTGCVLPGDSPSQYPNPVEFDLEIDLGPETIGRSPTIRRFEALLSSDNRGELGEAAKIWDLYRRQDVNKAWELFRNTSLPYTAVSILANKVSSPLSATVAALLLVRGRKFVMERHDLLPGINNLPNNSSKWLWIDNLSQLFPYLSDGSILWNEVLWDSESDFINGIAIRDVVRGTFEGLATRSLPFTVIGNAFLRSQIQDAFSDSGFNPPEVLRERVAKVSSYALPTGLFVALSGKAELIGPHLILP